MDCSLHGGCVVTSADWQIYHAIRGRADLSSPRVLETGLSLSLYVKRTCSPQAEQW